MAVSSCAAADSHLVALETCLVGIFATVRSGHNQVVHLTHRAVRMSSWEGPRHHYGRHYAQTRTGSAAIDI
jgi:hypothetical protein